MQYVLCLAVLVFSSMRWEVAIAREFTDGELVLDEFLVLPQVGRYGRVPIHVDPIAAIQAAGKWERPQAGDRVTSANGSEVSWTAAELSSSGWLEHEALQGGYAHTTVESKQKRIVLLEASGHAMVFVNGQPRAGDPYATGRSLIPIVLREGTNELLFHVAAGKLRATLKAVENQAFLDTRDLTAPTLVRGEQGPAWVSLLLVNCTEQPLPDAQVTSVIAGNEGVTSKVEAVPPLGVRKVAVPLLPVWDDTADAKDTLEVKLSLRAGDRTSEAVFSVDVVESNQRQTRTYRSAIDGSVQQYVLIPAKDNGEKNENALLVTLHDSNESAVDHIEQVSPVDQVHVVAPNGRRAEGCDWEDWSARDVLETLENVASHIRFDAQQVWLRGTSTGGHGVLRLGGIAPDRWAALVMRSPWLEYPSGDYDAGESPVSLMLSRVAWSNRLTPLLRNATGTPMMVEARGSVDAPGDPHSREVINALKTFQPDFDFASLDAEQGRADFSSAISFCEGKSLLPVDKVHEVDIVTYDPGLVASKHWLTIVSQQQQGSLTRAAVKFDPQSKLFAGLTANVAALTIDVTHLGDDAVVKVILDDEMVGEFASEGNQLHFFHNDDGWHVIPTMPTVLKQPSRYGGLRSAFENDALLVYGTHGSADENTWALAKARFDAESILSRMNGSVDVVADTAFNPTSSPERNVVLYGNADTNSAWPALLSDSPVQVRKDGVWIDRRPELGSDLACVFLQPRPGSTKAVVGVIGGTGINGLRATDRLPYFVNGTVFPDLLLLSSSSLIEGNADVRAAGYFGKAWTVDPGEIVWRDAAL